MRQNFYSQRRVMQHFNPIPNDVLDNLFVLNEDDNRNRYHKPGIYYRQFQVADSNPPVYRFELVTSIYIYYDGGCNVHTLNKHYSHYFETDELDRLIEATESDIDHLVERMPLIEKSHLDPFDI